MWHRPGQCAMIAYNGYPENMPVYLATVRILSYACTLLVNTIKIQRSPVDAQGQSSNPVPCPSVHKFAADYRFRFEYTLRVLQNMMMRICLLLCLHVWVLLCRVYHSVNLRRDSTSVSVVSSVSSRDFRMCARRPFWILDVRRGGKHNCFSHILRSVSLGLGFADRCKQLWISRLMWCGSLTRQICVVCIPDYIFCIKQTTSDRKRTKKKTI